MSFRKKTAYIILLGIVFISTWVIGYTLHVTGVHAQGLLPPCVKEGNCTLDDFLLVAVNAANMIMRIVGAIALVMFVIGGIWWLIAAGRPEMIKRGRNMLIGATIGLCLVFFSWFIVRAIQDVIGVREEYRVIGWAPKNCQVKVDDKTITAPDGTPCGTEIGKSDNEVCKGGSCISECKAYYGDRGYECKVVACDVSKPEEEFDKCVSEKGCFRNLCPGAKNNVCCKK